MPVAVKGLGCPGIIGRALYHRPHPVKSFNENKDQVKLHELLHISRYEIHLCPFKMSIPRRFVLCSD